MLWRRRGGSTFIVLIDSHLRPVLLGRVQMRINSASLGGEPPPPPLEEEEETEEERLALQTLTSEKKKRQRAVEEGGEGAFRSRALSGGMR